VNTAAATLPETPEPARAGANPARLLLAPLTYPLAAAAFALQFTVWMALRLLSQPEYAWVVLAGIVYVFRGNYWLLPLYAVESFLLVQVATFLFDVVHFVLHRMAESRSRLLRAIGAMHTMHHRFLDEELRIHDELRGANNTHHVLPEFATHVIVSLAAWPLLGPIPVARTLLLEVVTLARFFRAGGNDANHVAHPVVRATRPTLFVDTWYHSLHHVWPSEYYSSINAGFDRMFGYGCHVRGRRVALAGDAGVGAGAFGAELARLLARAGAVVTPFADGELRDLDVLVIAGGASAWRDELIERFRLATAGRRFPVEVWAIGGDREFAASGRRWYGDERLYYRHVVAPSGAGAGAARAAWFLIRRGFRYVPVDAAGLGLLGFFKFRFWTR